MDDLQKGKWYISEAYKAEFANQEEYYYRGRHRGAFGPFDTKAKAEKYKSDHPELREYEVWCMKDDWRDPDPPPLPS